jgi:membrane fusion protein (multidrug efflux system)
MTDATERRARGSVSRAFCMRDPQRRAAVLAISILLASVPGCRKSQPPAPPRPEVSVLTVKPENIPALFEFVGQAEASKRVEIRSQVTGVIVDRPYVEGTDVPEGAVLFRIEPTTYQATYRAALAQVEDARARLANAERNLGRLRPLLADRAVAQKDVDDAQTEAEEARAAVDQAAAAVDRAKKDYDDTTVRAQIAGRAGRAEMVLGARVTGPGDLLTTVEQNDPIYVYFSPSDQDVLRWRRDRATGRLIVPPGVLDVEARLADGSVMPHNGKLNFVDQALQPVTGTLQLRAEFPNAERALLPGQFVRVRLLGIQRVGAILVPQRAVQQGLGGTSVYVLDATSKPVVRDVQASSWQGGRWIIESGLQPGDRVVVDGIQKLAPGQPVRPVAYEAAADTTLRAPPDTTLLAAPGAPPPIRENP